MVSIDSVYQKVLALSNKEQRGYMTPQEFNLLADKVQNEMFDAYFHKLKTANVKPQTDLTHADERDILEEKIHLFKKSSTLTLSAETNADGTPNGLFSNSVSLPNDLYLMESLSRAEGQIVELDRKEIIYTEKHPLTKSTIDRSVYSRETSGLLKIYPRPLEETSLTLNYFAKPNKPKWGYVVINDKALYNSVTSVDFTLHVSEEEAVVSRILQLAGVIILKPEIIQMGAADQAGIKQSQSE